VNDCEREQERATMSDDDDLDLSSLPDEQLVPQMHDDLYDGLAEAIAEGTTILLDRGWAADRVLNDALVEGMRIVGIDFRDGILFVPEVLLAANAMKAGMEILRPLLAETGVERVGKVVIGTVKGDIHDIGKNLVGMMLEGAGFEVIDLGINNPVESYLSALQEHQPDILGMSALLTTTMPYMKVVIDELREKGLRDRYIVLVGGAPLNEEFGKAVGADAYCRGRWRARAVPSRDVQGPRARDGARRVRPARPQPSQHRPYRRRRNGLRALLRHAVRARRRRGSSIRHDRGLPQHREDGLPDALPPTLRRHGVRAPRSPGQQASLRHGVRAPAVFR
jgi:methylmalonyl-CoA mutase cobalamin-binding domain/chain